MCIESDAYTYLRDSKSAIKEYYSLKQKLALTDEELYNYKTYIEPNFKTKKKEEKPKILPKTKEASDFIEQIWKVRQKYNIRIGDISKFTGINRVTISRILHYKLKPSEMNLKLLQDFMEGFI